jgi:hypothetical protein
MASYADRPSSGPSWAVSHPSMAARTTAEVVRPRRLAAAASRRRKGPSRRIVIISRAMG